MLVESITRDSIGQLVEQLTGKRVVVRDGAVPSRDPTQRLAIAEFVFDDGRAAALCCCDLPLAAFLGAAPTGIPSGTAHEAVKDGKLGVSIADGFHEVMNVISGMVGMSCGGHVAMRQVHETPGELSGGLRALLMDGALFGCFDITIASYGTGRMALIAAGATAPIDVTAARVHPVIASTACAPGTLSWSQSPASAAPSPAGMVPERVVRLVEAGPLASHFAPLLGAIEIVVAPAWKADDAPWAALAAFVCDDGGPAAVCLCDLPLACAAAGALAGYDADHVRTAIAAGRIEGDLLDAFREVMNLLGGYLNQVADRHVVLRSVAGGPAPMPDHLAGALRHSRRHDFSIRFPGGLGAGRMLIIAR